LLLLKRNELGDLDVGDPVALRDEKRAVAKMFEVEPLDRAAGEVDGHVTAERVAIDEVVFDLVAQVPEGNVELVDTPKCA
jgi:hypothetical protein